MQYPTIMGVINRSPNSFYGVSDSLDQAFIQAKAMIDAGVGIIDIGGEATNPFVDLSKESPNADEELQRVVPLVEKIRKHNADVVISIDTSSPKVMRAAIAAGANMINDQRALQRLGAVDVVREADVPVVIMHMPEHREPGSSSKAQLLIDVKAYLQQRVDDLLKAGIKKERIILDPGFGQGHYGKNTEENFYLLKHLSDIKSLGYPLLVGWSRKSMIGDILQKPAQDRLFGSIATAILALTQGADIIRVHDVAASVDALKIFNAFEKE